MDPSTANYIEFSLLLVSLLVIFSAARHIAIYGRNSATNWALGIGIVICLACGMYFGGKRVPEVGSALGMGPAIMRPSADPKIQEAAKRSAARFNFLQRGEITTYPLASGESVRFEPSERDIADRAGVLTESSRIEAAQRTNRERLMIWLLSWIPVMLAGFVCGRIEYAYLVRKYQFCRIVKPQTFAEVEGFVGLLKAACEDPQMNSTLQVILEQSNTGRKTMIKDLLVRFREKGAPQILTDAFICLMDDEVADKVYVFIHKCERPIA